LKIALFGASGMVGQGVLRACLEAPDVEQVVSIVRAPTGATDPRVREVVHADFTDFSALAADLTGHDACFFCLGVSAAGMSEAAYTKITYDVTLAAAKVLVAQRSAMTFIYVSGAGTDSTERKRSMWARVKGRTENALMALPFKAAVMFRPGLIKPMHGIRSRTRLYRVTYAIITPIFPLLRWLMPGQLTTTENVGRAMLAVARTGGPSGILGNREINARATA
jgi:uncharacterized protein YbjT (DUF2867 family)